MKIIDWFMVDTVCRELFGSLGFSQDEIERVYDRLPFIKGWRKDLEEKV